ncbi:hypothetical protein K505DRAFT_322314 [Melanomma pulvis-pyrius CBS 109.77]|uniref:F-box domain-containing protein n=1 Tax=Melanomma pulvis-pyrius CBS 109.77 TaxID=1314802 RepID=A0A6A6XMQ5_9PLEO|nr:hypothetical protein K505DRAFT_322314 [Melanomma pulvis-pyrius CBS 109.77]
MALPSHYHSKPPTLLTLPPELRLIIYDILWEPLPSQITPSGLIPPTSLSSSSALNLLLVCRPLYYEAQRIAYTRHTFSLTRNFDTHPLLHEPRLTPHAYITSLLITGYRPLSPPHSPSPSPTPSASISLNADEGPASATPTLLTRCYTFKEICALVRRFKHLHTIVILTDELARVEKGLRSRKAHVGFRLRKARLLQDERFVPTYNLFGLDGRVERRWRLTVEVGTGAGAGAGEGEKGEKGGRTADLVLCGLVG